MPSGLYERAEDKTGSPEGAAQVPSRVGSHCNVDILPDKLVTLGPPVMRETIGFWVCVLLCLAELGPLSFCLVKSCVPRPPRFT